MMTRLRQRERLALPAGAAGKATPRTRPSARGNTLAFLLNSSEPIGDLAVVIGSNAAKQDTHAPA